MMAPVVNAVMEVFHWNHCVIITSSQNLHKSLGLETKAVLEATGVKVYFHVINPIVFNLEVGLTQPLYISYSLLTQFHCCLTLNNTHGLVDI